MDALNAVEKSAHGVITVSFSERVETFSTLSEKRKPGFSLGRRSHAMTKAHSALR
jgi:putative effector of murein hydrolase